MTLKVFMDAKKSVALKELIIQNIMIITSLSLSAKVARLIKFHMTGFNEKLNKTKPESKTK